MHNILIVEDESDIYIPLRDFLEENHFSTDVATTQEQAVALLENMDKNYDLALVDLKLPDGGHGFAVFPSAKARNIPVIFLTAMDDESNASFCLGLGEDYIPKPYRRKELLARIQNVLSKSGKIQSVLSCRDLVMDTAKITVHKGGEEVFLTRLEYRMLLVFMSNIGKIVTRDRLVWEIYDISHEWIGDNTLNVHIGRLRKKIEDDPNNPQFIQTVRGFGYKMDRD